MSILFECPHCHSRVRAKKELEGETGICPQCHHTIMIPESIPNDALAWEKELEENED